MAGYRLPYPDGLLIPRVTIVPFAFGATQNIAPANSMRVYLAIGGVTGSFVGFTRDIDAASLIGIPLPTAGVQDWDYSDVGQLLQLDLFAENAGFGVDYYVEEIENWPKHTSQGQIERAQAARIRNARAVRTVRRRADRLRALHKSQVPHAASIAGVRDALAGIADSDHGRRG